jgi:hypothetical protein
LVFVTTLVRLQRRPTRRRQAQGALGHLQGQALGRDAFDEPQIGKASQGFIRADPAPIGLAASDETQASEVASVQTAHTDGSGVPGYPMVHLVFK